MRRQQASGKEAADRHERGPLQVCHSGDSVTGSTPIRPTSSKADQKSANRHEQERRPCQEARPTKERSWGQPLNIGNPKVGQVIDSLTGYRNGTLGSEKLATDPPANDQAPRKDKQPESVLPPVVFQILDVSRVDGSAHVPKATGDTKSPPTKQE